MYAPDEDRPVAQSDWRSMSLNLAAFQSGMRQAEAPDAAAEAEAPAAAEPPVHVAPSPESGDSEREHG